MVIRYAGDLELEFDFQIVRDSRNKKVHFFYQIPGVTAVTLKCDTEVVG